MNASAIAFVICLGLAAAAALGLITWGLVLEARSNRCWRQQKLVS